MQEISSSSSLLSKLSNYFCIFYEKIIFTEPFDLNFAQSEWKKFKRMIKGKEIDFEYIHSYVQHLYDIKTTSSKKRIQRKRAESDRTETEIKSKFTHQESISPIRPTILERNRSKSPIQNSNIRPNNPLQRLRSNRDERVKDDERRVNQNPGTITSNRGTDENNLESKLIKRDYSPLQIRLQNYQIDQKLNLFQNDKPQLQGIKASQKRYGHLVPLSNITQTFLDFYQKNNGILETISDTTYETYSNYHSKEKIEGKNLMHETGYESNNTRLKRISFYVKNNVNIDEKIRLNSEGKSNYHKNKTHKLFL